MANAFRYNEPGLKTIKYLFKQGITLGNEINQYECMKRAVCHNSYEMLDLLFENGLNVNSKHDNINILNHCLCYGGIEFINYFLDKGVVPCINNLYGVLEIDNFTLLNLFLEKGLTMNKTELNYADSEGVVLLRFAKSKEMVKFLVKNGLNLEIKNCRGQSGKELLTKRLLYPF